jgi:phospholipid/cholesterol/gamma-HCH transport system substrate-binding protein
MMGEMITELRNLVLALKNSVASDENLAKLTQTVHDFSRLAESLADYVQKNRDNLDQSARNFVEASKALKNMINRNAERVDSVIVRADDVARRMEEMTANLEYMATSAREFADKLNRGDGTLQMLVDDRRLYDDLRKTADNLDDLIQDIRENPRKYLQLKVELF